MSRAEILEKLGEIYRHHAKGKAKSISYEDDVAQMGFDSLEISEIIMSVEEEFDCVIRMDDLLKLKTLNDYADYIMKETES
ncbi:acyl carrier protein [Candidatus Formimonas warabiya]|uniref:Carrier domain-containing protein n=1 Tax=Formimonas warabiya TaxID=1761012 RepID=A0A3G1KZP9_FORW1|nr:acyl carrier protein [Candidatus Formimonas warabiya]ATW27854.1 hypothetical protein DCMF_26630 [Candidatus Formimonas warabiya]